jgi:hypothetical protein
MVIPQKNKPFLLLACIAITLLNSCSRNKGCTDQKAINYEAGATKNCCCVFKGKAVLWFDQASSIHMGNHGIASLKLYIDKVEVGTLNATDFCSAQPVCGDAHAITYEKDLGTVSSSSYMMEAIDNGGNTIWVGNKTLISNTCQAIQINY